MWTQVTVFISIDDNHYMTNTSNIDNTVQTKLAIY